MTVASFAKQLHEQDPNSLSHFELQQLPGRRDHWRLKQIGLCVVKVSLFSHQHLLFVTNQDAVFLLDPPPSFPLRR
jgi:hypothetical protein